MNPAESLGKNERPIQDGLRGKVNERPPEDVLRGKLRDFSPKLAQAIAQVFNEVSFKFGESITLFQAATESKKLTGSNDPERPLALEKINWLATDEGRTMGNLPLSTVRQILREEFPSY